MNKKIILSWSLFVLVSLVFMFPHKALAAFQDRGDGTVTDSSTGLMWQQGDDQKDGEKLTWREALEYCESLNLAGRTDWRLPNVRELESLVDLNQYSPAINPVFDCRSSSYWSSSTCAYYHYWDEAWKVVFSDGFVYRSSKTALHYVRCVRGGPDGLFGDLDIKANGQDGPIVVTPGDQVSIEVSLDPGDKVGQNADWWIAATTPFAPPGDCYSCVYPTGWFPGINLCVQAPLFTLSPFEVLNIVLPSGEYTFYFAVDPPDGSPAGPWIGVDLVEVKVQ